MNLHRRFGLAVALGSALTLGALPALAQTAAYTGNGFNFDGTTYNLNNERCGLTGQDDAKRLVLARLLAAAVDNPVQAFRRPSFPPWGFRRARRGAAWRSSEHLDEAHHLFERVAPERRLRGTLAGDDGARRPDAGRAAPVLGQRIDRRRIFAGARREGIRRAGV
jgi:hypothetical protein